MANISRPNQFRFKVVLLQEAGQWVAQCLDFDVAAQGMTIREAKTNLAMTLGEHIVLAVHQQQTPFEGIPPAPENYWQLFKSGERLSDAEPIFVPPAFMINAMAEDFRIAS